MAAEEIEFKTKSGTQIASISSIATHSVIALHRGGILIDEDNFSFSDLSPNWFDVAVRI